MRQTLSDIGRSAVEWVGSRAWHWTAHALSVDAVEDPSLRRLRDVWQAARRATAAALRLPGPPAVPRVDLFDTRPLMGVLRWTALVAVEDGLEGARYALVGPALVRLFGRDPTGGRLVETYRGPVLREVLAAYVEVTTRAEPLYSTREFQVLGRSFGYRRLMLPLARGDAAAAQARVTHVVVGIVPADPRLVDATQWRDPRIEAAFAETAR
jgi:hypothetical protein